MHLFQKLKQTSLLILVVPIGSLVAQTLIDPDNETISLEEALHQAIIADSRLELNALRAEAAEGQIEQADKRPNPVVGVEAEDFLGTAPISDVQGIEITIGVSQVIETANKRKKRTALARAERSLVDWERESLLAEVEASVRSAFVHVLIAQALLDLRHEQLTLTEKSAKETARLVEAARSPQVEQTRAQLVVRQQQFALQQAQQELRAAKSVLASFWGRPEEIQFSLKGKIVLDSEIPDFATLASRLTTTAALARYEAKERTQRAALDLENARATQDFKVFAGGRYFNEANGYAGFVTGIQMPWPLFDKNQGNIRTARAQLKAVDQEYKASRQELMIRLNNAYQQLINAQAEADVIQSDLLPATEEIVRDTEEGYKSGQFTLLSVLESRAMLFDIREANLKALRRYAVAHAEIEVLTQSINP